MPHLVVVEIRPDEFIELKADSKGHAIMIGNAWTENGLGIGYTVKSIEANGELSSKSTIQD